MKFYSLCVVEYKYLCPTWWPLDLGDGQFSKRCDVDGSFFNSDAIPIIFLEKLNIAIVAIIFLDHWERLFLIILLILGPIILGLLFKGF